MDGLTERMGAAEIEELRKAILDAIHECGKLNGWQNSHRITSLSKWEERVRADGVFSPPSLYKMIKDDRQSRWQIDTLTTLARIMAHYGVLVDGLPMPEDYFLNLSKYRRVGVPENASPAWIREALKKLDEKDQLEILSWLATHFAHAKRKSLSTAK